MKTLVIRNCTECWHSLLRLTGRELICTHSEVKKGMREFKKIPNTSKFPSWCPLKDVEGE